MHFRKIILSKLISSTYIINIFLPGNIGVHTFVERGRLPDVQQYCTGKRIQGLFKLCVHIQYIDSIGIFVLSLHAGFILASSLCPAHPDCHCLVQAKPDSFLLVPAQPDYLLLVPAQPDYFLLVPAQPDYLLLVPAQPDYLLLIPAQPDYLLLVPAQPDYLLLVPAQPDYLLLIPAQPDYLLLSTRPTAISGSRIPPRAPQHGGGTPSVYLASRRWGPTYIVVYAQHTEPWADFFFEVLQLLIWWKANRPFSLAKEASGAAFCSLPPSTLGLRHCLRQRPETAVAPGRGYSSYSCTCPSN
jgi:hypothetical protein